MTGYENYKVGTEFHKNLLRHGELIGGIGTKTDKGRVEMLSIRYTNGVEFLVWVLNDEVIKVG